MTEAVVTYDVDQMKHDAQLAINLVLQLIRRDPDAKVWVEQKVHMRMTTDHVWGTADAVVYLPQFDELWVIDYKYGRVEVDPVMNPQLLIYMLCAIQTLHHGAGIPKKMVAAIVQPRADVPVKTWDVPSDYLFYEFLPDLKSSILAIHPDGLKKTATEEPEAKKREFVVSEDTCTFCPALHMCPAAAEKAFKACEFAELEGDGTTGVDHLEKWLPLLPVLKRWCDAQETMALMLLQSGQKIKGYEIGTSRTHRKWVDEDAVRELMRGKGFALRDIAPQKLLPPSQMEKLVKSSTKKLALSELSMYSGKPEGKPRLQKSKTS